MITCNECGNPFSRETSSGSTCYPCKLSGIRFNWRGATGVGRKVWHDGPTLGEANREAVANIEAAGGKESDFQTATRWV